MTRQERKAKRRELNDSLARVDATLPRNLDDWDRPAGAHLFAGAHVEVRADVVAGHA